MTISIPISNLLVNVDNNFNKKHKTDDYHLQIFDKVTELIFKDHYIGPKPYPMQLPLPRLTPEDTPLIKIVNQIADILYRSQEDSIGLHAGFTDKIKGLEKLQSDKINTKSFTSNEMVNDYCTVLIKECISSLKNEEKGVIERTISAKNLKTLGVKGNLSKEQYQLLRSEGALLDKFFENIEPFLKTSKKGEGFFEQFMHVWTLTLTPQMKINKKDRATRIKSLEECAANLPKGLAANTEAYNALKANLNFMLAAGILAKETKSSSPKQAEINRARQILEECKEFSKPAEILLKTDFNTLKTFKPDPKEMKLRRRELQAAIKEAGCEDLVSKRDLKEVFKMTDPALMKKDQMIRALKTIAAILTFPIVWTALIAFFLIFGLIGWIFAPHG